MRAEREEAGRSVSKARMPASVHGEGGSPPSQLFRLNLGKERKR
jgi:hypothetical protein